MSAKLSWSHYIALIGVSDDTARKFYEKHTLNENLSVRELERQIDSSLFERLALSKDKKGVLNLSEKGHIVSHSTEAVKDPYVLDFLKIPQSHKMTEKDLEQKIIDNLQMFLLELGKGFAFVARQYRISLRNKHYSIDLVFYHRILKCFVLIDLKIRNVINCRDARLDELITHKGGIHGFYRLLSIMADKKHIEYKEMKRWVSAN
ncbi:MAG: PDDEXK nuclease domain-containing protein [Sediminibacterium sp.]|nr:PDDEXK nuclease domain-containing protein [Sediminibacterium sp.]